MTKLVVVESPAKSKTISKYLGAGYEILSSVGHIRDLPKSNKNAIDIAAGFVPNYEIVSGKEKVVGELQKACAGADEVILATDPDREGEAIAWHVASICGLVKGKKPVTRIVFHEITKPAVEEAIKHPRKINEGLRRAQEARRVLDRLFGYDLSGLIWKKVRYGLSAGRVQSPALRILMEREREVRAFKPEQYWIISAKTETSGKHELALVHVKEPRDRKEVERVLSIGKTGAWSVIDVKATDAKRSPRAPFITSTLQQTASTRFGFPPSRTMQLAQRLYEAGYITYMRTDSTNLSALAQKEMAAYIKKAYGDEYTEPRWYKTKSRSAQEAHEAIRPTDVSKKSAGRTDDQKKLYRLIWQRALASQASDAKIARTKVVARAVSPKNPKDGADFSAQGSQTLFPGWLAIDPEARGDDVSLPAVKIGEGLVLKDILAEDRETQPPSRYTEAGLIKELEKRGIGRPSTYASIIKTLADRNYANRVGRTLYTTDLGEVVNDFLEKNFEKYVSDSFTAELESELDEIADGKRGYVETLKNFYTPFSKEIRSKKDIEKLTNLGDAPKELRCPKCKSAMIVKLGKNGKFYSCSRFPDCPGARGLDGREMEGPKETGEKCPECGNPLIEREGRFGKFIGCSSYPKCKYIKQTEEAQKPTTEVPCPECTEGKLTERRGRFGIFYGCSNYPKCRFAMKAKPTGENCPECGSLMMLGTKTIPERCSKKECPRHNPHKLKLKEDKKAGS